MSDMRGTETIGAPAGTEGVPNDAKPAEGGTEAQGFDLTAAKQVAEREDEGQIIYISDATGEPLYYRENGENKRVWVELVGRYSPTYRRAEESVRSRRLKQRSRNLSVEQLERESIHLIASAVKRWGGFFDAGKPIPCDTKNVETVLMQAPWVREQLDDGIGDHAGFSEASSKG